MSNPPHLPTVAVAPTGQPHEPPLAPSSGDADRRTLGSLGLATILAAYGLPVLSFFSVTVALGSIRADLDASPAVLQLVVAAFGVAYASAVVIGGRLGDNRGRRHVMIIGLLLFGAASAACALAPTSLTLVLGRVVQGLGAALLAPQVLSTIQAHTAGEARAQAMGLFGAMAGIATCVAFIGGGAIVAANLWGLGWRLVFWLNVPIAVLALVGQRFVPDSRAKRPAPSDGVGALALAVTVVLVVLPVTEGRAAGWPVWTWIMLALVGPAAIAFWRWEGALEERGGAPLVPRDLIAIGSVRAGLAILALFFGVFGAFMFVYALAAGRGPGMGPMAIGASLGPFAVAFLVSSLGGARLAAHQPYTLMKRGALTASAGYAAMAAILWVSWPHFSAWHLAVPFLLTGTGQGWLVVPLFGTILAGVPAQQAGVGSGVLITTMQMALGLGAAVIGSLYLVLSERWSGALPVVAVLALTSFLLLAIVPLADRLRPAS